MSVDSVFGRIAFPRVRDDETTRADEMARAQGHAAGYTRGLHAAADEVARRSAEMEAEHAESRQLGDARIDRGVRLLRAAAQALDERSMPLLREAEDTLVHTALDLAEAVLGSELSRTEPSARRALERAQGRADDLDRSEIHTIRMHPDDLAVLGTAISSLTEVKFVADALIHRGDALTEFSDGFLDASISTAFARAKAALLGDSA
ncbi:MAG: hypothetical protein LH475_07645 [Cryobacterium sp.]|uniref:FliH/SctL family protein n=1 Tax=unclassified Cryobacterium TaxID=2649013 RepID=UPI0018CBA771|nr:MULTISPECIES: FliH/SctL family protein [unclassified Cryobacterium]MCY7404484.1 hypothetical protein [Cryobacterium sp.]MEC5153990.1 flagellar assembly protein FliH [Cryobacterium sp. CAN_C3]